MVRGGHIYRGRKPVYWSPSTRTVSPVTQVSWLDGGKPTGRLEWPGRRAGGQAGGEVGEVRCERGSEGGRRWQAFKGISAASRAAVRRVGGQAGRARQLASWPTRHWLRQSWSTPRPPEER